MDWRSESLFPRPDFLSSSRKRLAPQLMFKGGILKSWNRKVAVALNKSFYETLPTLKETKPSDADIAWMVYELKHSSRQNTYALAPYRTIYTKFEAALDQITRAEPGPEEEFINHLQMKLDEKIESSNPPDNSTIEFSLEDNSSDES